MDILFGVIITILSLIGLRSVFYYTAGIFMKRNKAFDVDISMNICIGSCSCAEHIVRTAKFIRDKYMPEMRIIMQNNGISEENAKIIKLLDKDGTVSTGSL